MSCEDDLNRECWNHHGQHDSVERFINDPMRRSDSAELRGGLQKSLGKKSVLRGPFAARLEESSVGRAHRASWEPEAGQGPPAFVGCSSGGEVGPSRITTVRLTVFGFDASCYSQGVFLE